MKRKIIVIAAALAVVTAAVLVLWGPWSWALLRKNPNPGSKTVTVTIKYDDQNKEFTYKTDLDNIGKLLEEHKDIDYKIGSDGFYSFYGKEVGNNAQAYFAFYINGDYAQWPPNDANAIITDGDAYVFEYATW